MQNFPVTLYTFPDCGSACQQARELLNKRGIPFTEKSLTKKEDMDAFRKDSGDSIVPSATIGKTWVKGFLADQWTKELDFAGYPKTVLTYPAALRCPLSCRPPLHHAMKLATWNVNSLKVRLPHLLEWLAANPVDVVCLQETKTEDKNFPLAELQQAGYQVAFSGQKTYNGVAILSRQPVSDVQYGIPVLRTNRSALSPRPSTACAWCVCTSRTGRKSAPTNTSTNSSGWPR